MTAAKMTCPRCGAEMNLHAKKVDPSATARDPEAADPDLGGIVNEIHACPQCGQSASRRRAS